MFFLRVILIAATFIYVGCSSDDKSPNTSVAVDNGLVNQTAKDLLEFEQVFALGQVFQDHPQADERLLRSALNKSRAGILILQNYQQGIMPLRAAELAYNELSSALYLLERVQLLEGEAEEIKEIFDQVRLVHHQLALSLGKDTNRWVLYKHNFADGIEPEFRAPQGEDQYGSTQWTTNFQIDLPKAKIQARNGYAWMVSRNFDLSNVIDPVFRFHASHLVSSSDSKLTLYEVVHTVFKTYIILDLQPGESLEEIPDERKIRVPYGPDEVPKAQDFHDTWLPFRSLEKYKGHEVAIAFLFDTREISDPQFYIWDIYDFEIVGAGPIKIAPYTYNPLFTSLGDFNSLTSIFAGPEWAPTKSGLSIQSNGNAEAVLISPMFYTVPLPMQSNQLTLTLEEELISVDPNTTAEILISTEYVPGHDFSKETQGWQPVKALNKTGNSQIIDLQDYILKDFYIAFYFKSNDPNDSWNINNFLLQGDGVRIHALGFQAQDANSLDKVNTENSFDFTKEETQNLLQQVQENDKSPRWQPSRDEDGMRASGYFKDGNLTGLSRLIIPGVELTSGNNLIRLVHKIGFMSSAGNHLNVYIKLSDSEDDWTPIQFGKGDLTEETNRKFEQSKWAPIPQRYASQKVDISFTYQASEAQAPEWIIQTVELGLGVVE